MPFFFFLNPIAAVRLIMSINADGVKPSQIESNQVGFIVTSCIT